MRPTKVMSPRKHSMKFTIKQRRHPDLFQASSTTYALTNAVTSKWNERNEINHRNHRNQKYAPNAPNAANDLSFRMSYWFTNGRPLDHVIAFSATQLPGIQARRLLILYNRFGCSPENRNLCANRRRRFFYGRHPVQAKLCALCLPREILRSRNPSAYFIGAKQTKQTR